MESNKKTPKIRFKGFDEPWEKKKFDEVFDILSNNTLSRDNLNNEQGSTQNVHYGDILVKFGEYTDIDEESLPYITDEEVAAKLLNMLLKDGDVIIADTAEDAIVGKCTEIGNIGEKKVVAGLHTMPCRPKIDIAPRYMGYYMNSSAYHDKLYPLMQGVKVVSIARSSIKNTEFHLHSKIDEQEKIGNLFYYIDDLIQLEEERCKKLQTIRTTMQVKLFPQKGQEKPEIRFKDYDDTWKECPLKDITDRVIVGLATSVTPFYRKSGTPLIRNLNIKENYLDDTDILYLDEKYAAENESKKIRTGDVLTVHTGSNIGLTCILPEKYDGCLSFTTLITTPKKKMLDSVFLMQYLNSPEGKNRIFSVITAGGKPNLNSGDLEKVMICYPDIDEQKRIGRYLSQMDYLITNSQSRCEKLRAIKKGCMKNMFV